jgi:hypothetical protein
MKIERNQWAAMAAAVMIGLTLPATASAQARADERAPRDAAQPRDEAQPRDASRGDQSQKQLTQKLEQALRQAGLEQQAAQREAQQTAQKVSQQQTQQEKQRVIEQALTAAGLDQVQARLQAQQIAQATAQDPARPGAEQAETDTRQADPFAQRLERELTQAGMDRQQAQQKAQQIAQQVQQTIQQALTQAGVDQQQAQQKAQQLVQSWEQRASRHGEYGQQSDAGRVYVIGWQRVPRHQQQIDQLIRDSGMDQQKAANFRQKLTSIENEIEKGYGQIKNTYQREVSEYRQKAQQVLREQAKQALVDAGVKEGEAEATAARLTAAIMADADDQVFATPRTDQPREQQQPDRRNQPNQPGAERRSDQPNNLRRDDNRRDQ